MAIPEVNSYTSFQLTDKEAREGSILTTAQKQVLCNMRALYAEACLTLALDAANINEFIQTDAALKSKIELITDLINVSDDLSLPLKPSDNA